MPLIKKFTPQNSDSFLGKDQGDHSLAKFGHLNYILRQVNSSLLNFTPGSLLFADTNGDPAGDPTQLYWDDVNNRLGIGVSAPTKTIDALGTFLLTGTNTAYNTDSLYLGGSFTIKDPYPRSKLSTGQAMGNNINSQYEFRNESDGVTKEMSVGSTLRSYYSHVGPLGNTVWGNNIVWPQRRAGHFMNRMSFPSGSYTLNSSQLYSNTSLWVNQYFGSSDNTSPLTINTGSGPDTGISGVAVRMDTWPNSDSGTAVKTYTGWHNMYTGFYDIKGGVGSTTQRMNFYVAGHTRHYANTTLTDIMGFYCYPMKNSWTTNAWAFYQDGASDKNYLAGNTIIGSSNTDVPSAKLQVTSTTQGFLPPRMTGAQVEAIASPAEGLMVYATSAGSGAVTSKGWWGYDGATWVKLN